MVSVRRLAILGWTSTGCISNANTAPVNTPPPSSGTYVRQLLYIQTVEGEVEVESGAMEDVVANVSFVSGVIREKALGVVPPSPFMAYTVPERLATDRVRSYY